MLTRTESSFQRHLLWALIGVGVLSVIVLATLLVTIHFLGSMRAARQDLEAQVRVVAIHSEAALSFEDRDTGRENLSAFRAAPGVNWAALYDVHGDRFAIYTAEGVEPPPAQLKNMATEDQSGLLIFRESVVHDDQPLGVIIAAYDMNTVFGPLRREIALSLLMVGLVLGGAVAMALRLRRKLTIPLQELVQTAQRIAESDDYAARARKHAPDELGNLTDTFNFMLDRIVAQRGELQRRNDEMQRFLYTVSHDLKSPLVTITGFVGIVREDLVQKQYDQLDESLTHLVRASQHMGKLIDGLLELSRIGRIPTDPQQLDTGALVRDVIDDLHPRIDEAHAAVTVADDLPQVYADPVRMRQVFENLLTNAIKYGSDGKPPVIEVGSDRSGGRTWFYVRDHGPGIDPEHRQRVFTLFQRLHSSSDGKGVGLTIVAKIIEVSGGEIRLDATEGGGATFRFTLPDHTPDHPPTQPLEGH